MSATRTEQVWLDEIRALIMRGQLPPAQALLAKALAEYPSSRELRRAQAGALQQAGRGGDAESVLRTLLETDAGDASAAFALARSLRDQGCTSAAAAVMSKCFAREANLRDAELVIAAIELLDDCDRKRDAADIAEAAIALNPDEARLHAYAGMLQVQLGEFEQARRHYLAALHRDGRAWEWHVPIGLSSAQRYRDDTHADFALFHQGLHREGLSDKARAELHFALGKAHDDIDDYDKATRHFQEGNAIAHQLTKWSRKAWRRTVEARLASAPPTGSAEPTEDFIPVFIVGVPRSGTTLLAELLSRRPHVCNRGELPWLAKLAGEAALAGDPDRVELQRAASRYVAQARRDDASAARWFIDKQPLNCRYVDLALAMFPNAKIVHCQRSPRANAFSLWMQCFLEDVQGYAYDFSDIALVMRDCERLMAHWYRRFPTSIRDVRYEELVSDPHAVIEGLAGWLGLPQAGAETALRSASASAISTASLWQARQPVNTRSVDRWQQYVPYVPELMNLPAS